MKTQEDYYKEADDILLFEELSNFLKIEDYESYMSLHESKWEYIESIESLCVKELIEQKSFLLKPFYKLLFWCRGYHL